MTHLKKSGCISHKKSIVVVSLKIYICIYNQHTYQTIPNNSGLQEEAYNYYFARKNRPGEYGRELALGYGIDGELGLRKSAPSVPSAAVPKVRPWCT